MNHYSCTGRLVRDPETRSFASGSSVTQFTLAVSDKRKNKQTGEWEDDAVFIDMKAWGKTGELIAEHFQKGDPIIVCEGKLQQEKWEKDGQKRSKHVVTVERFEFVPRTKDRGEDGAGKGKREKAGAAVADDGTGFDAGEDDSIPF